MAVGWRRRDSAEWHATMLNNRARNAGYGWPHRRGCGVRQGELRAADVGV